jgi:hypothetical protein
MHHRRRLAGLSLKRAADLAGVPEHCLSPAERGRYTRLGPVASAALKVCGAPADEVRQAVALLEDPGQRHRHRVDAFAPSSAWEHALAAGARSITFHIAGPAALAAYLVRNQRVPADTRGRTTVLLNEPVLRDVEQSSAQYLVDLADRSEITVQLVQEAADAGAPLRAVHVWTKRDWDGSTADLRNRRIFVTDRDGAPAHAANGPAATADARLLDRVMHATLPSAGSLHILRQAAREGRRWL